MSVRKKARARARTKARAVGSLILIGIRVQAQREAGKAHQDQVAGEVGTASGEPDMAATRLRRQARHAFVSLFVG